MARQPQPNRRHRNQQNSSLCDCQRSRDRDFALKVIVPMTDWKDRYAARPQMARLEVAPENGLTKLSAVDTFQIRSVSETQLIRKLGQLPDSDIQLVSQALATVLSL